ncbi:hypothetical protein [Parasphingorhabdus litoris]|nr:hypothetical protein [Parasphingorhabdus litoris]
MSDGALADEICYIAAAIIWNRILRARAGHAKARGKAMASLREGNGQ